MPVHSIFQVARLLRDQEISQTALYLRRQDNAGSKWLSEYAPHLLAQLEELSLQWLVIPKASVASMEGLQETIKMCNEFDELHFPIQMLGLPSEVSDEEFYSRLEKCKVFLEDEVAPVLQKMPKPAPLEYVNNEEIPVLEDDVNEEVNVDNAITKKTSKQNITGDVSADKR